jgi:pimeloyl-ACP methyl ester carboxylesterase
MTARSLARSGLVVLAAALAVVFLTSGPGRRTPAPHRAVRITAGDLTLRAVRAGRGPTVILLHGYGESLVAWRGLFDRLAADADVIALDLPGFGLSDKPDTGYTTEQMGRTVLDAARALGVQRFILVGHSLGGAVAAAVALAAPDRVSALVLVDAAGVSAPVLLPDTAEVAGDAVRAAFAEYAAQRTRFTAVHDAAWLSERPEDLAYLPADDSLYRQSLTSVLREFDFEYLTADRVRQLSIPTLVIWGAFDPVIPTSHGEWLADHIPSARLLVLDRTWHRPHVERPAETADSIASFIRALRGAVSP